MSVQLDRIKNLIQTMISSSNNNAEALDEGIRSVSNFSGAEDLRLSVALELNSYLVHGRSAEDFLRERCGIILENDDTGAITGSDAGGAYVKTAESVVPESSGIRFPVSGNYSTWSITNASTGESYKNVNVVYPTDVVNSLNNKFEANGKVLPNNLTDKELVLVGLSSWWLDQGIKLVEESLGLDLENSGKNWTIQINFSNSSELSKTTFASTRWSWRGNEGTMTIRINMDRYKQMKYDENGKSDNVGKFYLDRVMAHELTHGTMGSFLGNKQSEAPLWFVEGTAELVNGCDDTRLEDIRSIISDPYDLYGGMHTGDNYSDNCSEYTSGYIALRYLAQTGGSVAAGSTFIETAQERYSDDYSTLVMKGDKTDSIWLDGQHGKKYISTIQNIDASECSGNDNILAGNEGSNVIRAGSGTASLWGGNGGNDLLVGGSGADIFWYGNGEGADTIQNSSSTDTVMLYNPMNFETISMSGNDLHIGIGGGNSLNVTNWDESRSVNTFQLWDGTRWGLHKNGNGNIEAYRK